MKIYVIGPLDRGPVKIGVSEEPRTRIPSLQTGHPYFLDLLAECHGGEYDEEKLHRLFAKERLAGEWFKRSRRVIKFIEMISCGVSLSMAMEQCGKPQRRGKSVEESNVAKIQQRSQRRALPW